MPRSSENFSMLTIFDEEIPSRPVPAEYASGADPTFTIYDGVSRGIAVLARFSWWKSLLGFKVQPHDGPLTITIDIKLDEVAHSWWLKKHEEVDSSRSRETRHVFIRCQGDVVGAFTVQGEAQRISHTFVVDGRSIPDGGLLMLDFAAFEPQNFTRSTNIDPLRGLEITKIDIQTKPWTPSPQTYVDAVGSKARWMPQGCVTTDDAPATLRFRVLDQPKLHAPPDAGFAARTWARGARKAGLLQRQRQRAARQGSADSAVLHRAFPVVAKHPDGSDAEVQMQLNNDVLELTFPPSKAGHRKVSIFELRTDPDGLQEIGFSERVAFTPEA